MSRGLEQVEQPWNGEILSVLESRAHIEKFVADVALTGPVQQYEQMVELVDGNQLRHAAFSLIAQTGKQHTRDDDAIVTGIWTKRSGIRFSAYNEVHEDIGLASTSVASYVSRLWHPFTVIRRQSTLLFASDVSGSQAIEDGSEHKVCYLKTVEPGFLRGLEDQGHLRFHSWPNDGAVVVGPPVAEIARQYGESAPRLLTDFLRINSSLMQQLLEVTA